MSRGPAAFRQGDLKRAVKGALDAGLPVAEVILTPTGVIRVRAVTAGTRQEHTETAWDRKYNV